MICPNCGSIQANYAISCTVCGYEFSSSQLSSIVPSAKRKLNKWEILLIIIWSFIIFTSLRIAEGIFGLFLIVMIASITIFGIIKRKKWVNYIILGFCLLFFLVVLFGLPASNPQMSGTANPIALFIPLIIIILPVLYFVWKLYKNNKNLHERNKE